MKNFQARGQAAWLGIVGIFGAALLIGIAGLVIGYFSFSNEANRQENGITAAYSNNQNVYDNGWKTVIEKAQVPAEYTNQLRSLYTDALKGRYGATGSKALFQFIKEQNPTIDVSVYRDLQQSVESFHLQFQQAQTELVSRRQVYNNYLTATFTGRIYNFIGHYPHIDLSKYDIVTSEKTQQDFDSKKAGPLKLFPDGCSGSAPQPCK